MQNSNYQKLVRKKVPAHFLVIPNNFFSHINGNVMAGPEPKWYFPHFEKTIVLLYFNSLESNIFFIDTKSHVKGSHKVHTENYTKLHTRTAFSSQSKEREKQKFSVKGDEGLDFIISFSCTRSCSGQHCRLTATRFEPRHLCMLSPVSAWVLGPKTRI